MKNKGIFWIVWLTSLGLFFMPIKVATSGGLGFDKLVHVLIFAALTYYAILAYKKIVPIAILLILYSIFVELAQKQFFTYRSFETFDIAAGLVGITLIMLTRHENRN